MDASDRLRRARAFLLDMDGTIYVGEKLVPGALALVATLRHLGRPFLFLTNNSAKGAGAYRERLGRLGIDATVADVMTSGDATIEFLVHTTRHRSVYLVGTPALEADFRAAGFDLDADDPDCVVVGYDMTLTFAKLERACTLLFRQKPYYATHPDKTCITPHGLIPDIAAIIAACEAVTGRTPKIIGKPFPEIVASALGRLGGVAASDAVMVGDQLDTDMTMARESGLLGALVMTGETTPGKLAAWPWRPDLVVPDAGALAALLRGSA
jgi:HAD superfamily hydrolase (TIGR01450 family)